MDDIAPTVASLYLCYEKMWLYTVCCIASWQYFNYEISKYGGVEELQCAFELQVILMNENVIASQPIVLAVAPQAFSRIAEFLDKNDMMFVITNDDLQK